jgi:hypothetical protein
MKKRKPFEQHLKVLVRHLILFSKEVAEYELKRRNTTSESSGDPKLFGPQLLRILGQYMFELSTKFG